MVCGELPSMTSRRGEGIGLFRFPGGRLSLENQAPIGSIWLRGGDFSIAVDVLAQTLG
jgi:hypothetical protein